MKFNNPYWTMTQKIEMLQRWILFHSYVYYTLNTNFVSDNIYDSNAHELYLLMKNHPSDALKSRYMDIYQGYDGNSGFFLTEALEGHSELKASIEYDVKIAKIRHNI